MDIEAGFGGHPLAARAINGFRLSETRYDPSSSMAAHAHGNPYFCVVRRGGFCETSRRRSVEHTAGAIVFHAAGEEHADRFLQRGARCFNVEVLAQAGKNAAAALPHDVVSPRLRTVFSTLYTEFASASPSPLVLEGLVYQALGEAFERTEPAGGRRAAWIERVRDEIQARLDENLTLGDLAAGVDVHPVHLARSFRNRFGMNVTTYILEQRVLRAKELLVESPASLAGIAAAAGFADQSHFCRVFKRHLGVTPGQFRAAGTR